MCGRYGLHASREELERRFRIDLAGIELEPRYNVAPSQDVLTIAIGREGARRALRMRWGFIPFWSKEPRTKLSTINAKVETVDSAPMYRDAFRRRRCLLLADGFYEWQPVGTGRRVRKVPHWIHRSNDQPFAFAGLYSVWRPKEGGEPLLSCTILVAPASEALARIHDRMPVILRPENEESWIDRQLQDVDAVKALLAPDDPGALEARSVSTAVNSPDHEGSELIREAP
jgi:putative SOS response-associated peptidase YedK